MFRPMVEMFCTLQHPQSRSITLLSNGDLDGKTNIGHVQVCVHRHDYLVSVQGREDFARRLNGRTSCTKPNAVSLLPALSDMQGSRFKTRRNRRPTVERQQSTMAVRLFSFLTRCDLMRIHCSITSWVGRRRTAREVTNDPPSHRPNFVEADLHEVQS
jgi:hypothetical protein